jgi:hypothetical protein
VPGLEKPAAALARLAGRVGPRPVRSAARLLEVFWPYLTYDTVFDSSRAVEEIGRAPVAFSRYAPALLKWARAHDFRYPAREWTPDRAPGSLEDVVARAATTNGKHAVRKAAS